MPRSTGNKRLLRFFLSTLACLCLLALLAFGIIYQEFGPVEVSSIEMIKVREAGIIAEFFYPKGSKKLPIVISLAGSGGGMLEDKDMQLLALEGYAVLSLAYFKMEGLPYKLEEIPLEYFKQAIGWVSEQPVVDPNKIIVLGISRGAELALLLASVYPQIKGVIAFAPGNIILPNVVDIGDSTPSHSSWTLAGKPFPFAPLQELPADNSKPIRYRSYIEPLLERSDREIYTIKVENSKGPILLLSGQDDQQWPSERMATLIEGRLKDKNYPYEVRNVIYPDAGHWLLSFKDSYPIIASSFFRNGGMNINGKYYQFENGGTAWGTMVARRNARKETLQFLKQFK